MKKFLQRFFILVLLFVTIFTFAFKPRKANAFIFALPVVTVAEYLAGIAVTYLAGVQISNTVNSLEINKMTSSFVHTILSVSDFDNWFYSSSNCNFYYNSGSSLFELGYDSDTNTFSFYLVSEKFNILFSNWNDSSAYSDLYDVESNLLVSNCSKDTKPPIKPEGNKYLISASVSSYLVKLCGALSDDLVADDNGIYKGTLRVDNKLQFDNYSNTFVSDDPVLYYNQGYSDDTALSFNCPTYCIIQLTDNTLSYDISYQITNFMGSKLDLKTISIDSKSSFINQDESTSSIKPSFSFSECSKATYLTLKEEVQYNSYYNTYQFRFVFNIIDPMNNFKSRLFFYLQSIPSDIATRTESASTTIDLSVSASDKFYVTDNTTFSDVYVDTSTYPADDYTITVDPSRYNVESDSEVTDDIISQVADNVSVDKDKKTSVAGVTVENSDGDIVSDGSTSEDTDNKSFFSKILDFLKDILNAILGLPSLIAKAFEYLFEFVTDLLKNIVSIIQDILQGICDLPMNVFNFFRDILNNLVDVVSGIADDILNGLKDLFIPDADYFSSRFDTLQDKLKDKLSTDSYSAIFGTSMLDRDVEDMTFDLGFTTLVIKTSYYNRFKVMLKYVFMGIFFFLMCKYNYNQVYKIFRNTSEAEVSKYIGGGE